MADQILSPIVGKLVDYVGVPVGRLFSYLLRYHANLEEFRSQLSGLETKRNDVKLMIEAAERKGEVILPSVEAWLKRVDAAYDESKGFFEEEDVISKHCFNGPLNLKVRYRRSRKAKKKALEFDAIKKDGTFDLVSLPAPPLQIGSMINENEFDFESRRLIFNEIMDAIKDDAVGMIGIWGMPGIGKTTLVKRAAKCARDEGLFEEVAMAVVSQKPSVKAIQAQIADTISLKFTSESEEGRAGQLLQRLLASKKIMVILDDIWDTLELNDIGIPSGNQQKGCKIILTSRKRGVCEEMGSGKNFPINLLSANKALDLFLRMSGIEDRFSEKGRLAENLSEECGRLPICIAITARGLLNKEQLYWADMLNRLCKSDPDRKVHATIELSYDNLYREEEKLFFLLCALFPEDYKIPVQVLFEYGIGLNLFEKVDNVDEALVRAWNLASRLKSQCLLLDEGNENFVKMHDVIRDVALAIASKGKHEFLVQAKTTSSFWSDNVKKLPDVLECPQLQILMLRTHNELQLHDNFFAVMKRLIVLDISSMSFVQLPQSLAGLENLQTLRFTNCFLRDISTIGKLQKLVCLSFRGSHIKVLPEEVGELRNLRLLDLWSCRELEVITPGVLQNLSQLEVLRVHYMFQWCHPKNTSVSELIHLSRLMILEICIPKASMLPDELLFENLTKFKVSIGRGGMMMNIFLSNSQVLRLRYLSENDLLKAGIKMLIKKAQHLELKDIPGISIALPSHLGGYRSLNKLIVEHCLEVDYVLDVGESEYEVETPSLQQLHLIDLPLLKEIIKGKFPTLFFSKLEDIKLHNLPHLVHLWEFDAESATLANLTIMSVESCNKLEYVFDHSSAKSISKLRKLEVKECRNLQEICLSKQHVDVIDFPRLSHLKLLELENLMSFCSKFTSESILFSEQVIFHALKTLHIKNILKVEKIWHIQTLVETFFRLKVLKLSQCPELLVVFPSQAISALQNLEEISIKNCEMLETFFSSDDVPLSVSDEMVLFPRLVTLKLVNLPKFKAIISTASQKISQATVIFHALEKVHINNLEKLEIWHIQIRVEPFLQLKVLELTQCPELLVVFPSQTISSLPILEEMCIENCLKLEALFLLDDVSLNVGDETVLFPRLLTLKLVNLPKFTTILSTTSHNTSKAMVISPILKSIHVKGLNSMKKILHDNVSTKCFSQLQQLHVSECDQLVEVFPCHLVPNLNSLKQVTIKQCNLLEKLFQLDSCPVSETKTMTILKQLENLHLNGLPELRQIWWTNDERLWGVKVIFPIMKVMRLFTLDNLESIVHRQLLTSFPKLKELQLEGTGHLSLNTDQLHVIQGLKILEDLIIKDSYPDGKDILQTIATLPKLKNLKLDSYPTLIKWSESLYRCGGFQSLTSLYFYHCNGLKNLFTPLPIGCLAQLEYLFVSKCEAMESIVRETRGEQNFDNAIEFSKLCILELRDLPCLSSFYNRECALKFLYLNSLTIKDCPKLKTLAAMARKTPEPSSPKLVAEALFGQQIEQFCVGAIGINGRDMAPCPSGYDLSELSHLSVKGCDRLLKLFPSNLLAGLQKLESLDVKSCRSLEHVLVVEDHPLLLSNMKQLTLEDLPELKQLWWNKNSCKSFGLPKLDFFKINTCPRLEFIFDPSIGDSLKNLIELNVENCSSMVKIVAEQPGKKIEFPLLKTLELVNLSWFKVKQDVEFPRAQNVVIDGCFNINGDKIVKCGHELVGLVRYFESFVE